MQTVETQSASSQLSYNPYQRSFPYPMDQSYIPKDYNPMTITQKLLLSANGNQNLYEDFLKIEQSYSNQLLSKENNKQKLKFITTDGVQGSKKAWDVLRSINNIEYDVVILGDIIGIFYATTILSTNNNWNVGVIKQRYDYWNHEWNLSRKDLLNLVNLGLLSQDDMEYVIVTEYEGCRSGFKNKEVSPLAGGYFENDKTGYECFLPNIVNLGVSPKRLLDIMYKKFENLGGKIINPNISNTKVDNIVISESKGAAVTITSKDDNDDNSIIVTSRLILDCMGNNIYSNVQNENQSGNKPDSICVVVGTTASGYDPNTNKIGDLMYTNMGLQDKGDDGKYQYFWQSFPVGIKPTVKGGSNTKTTFMYTYLDAEEYRPSISTFFEDYWKFLPYYQQSISNPDRELDVHRMLYACFPTYKNKNDPLSFLNPDKQEQEQPTSVSRLLSITDITSSSLTSSSSIMIKSPIIFGIGYSFNEIITRHLERISISIDEALQIGCLHRDDLALINPSYVPSKSLAYTMFQKVLTIKRNETKDSDFINRLLAINFQMMNDDRKNNHDDDEEEVLTPFLLQDAVRLDGLLNSLSRTIIRDPTFVPAIIQHIGLYTLLSWLGDVGMLTLYTGLHTFVSPVIDSMIDKEILSGSNHERQIFYWKRSMDTWKYGSGCDYAYKKKKKKKKEFTD